MSYHMPPIALHDLRENTHKTLIHLQEVLSLLILELKNGGAEVGEKPGKPMTFSNEMMIKARQLQGVAENAKLTLKNFMDNTKTEHSEFYVTEPMTQMLEISERILEDFSYALHHAPDTIHQNLDRCLPFTQELNQLVDQIKEQRLSHENEFHWTMF